ncbi:MAG: VTT domain-containing protein [Desulfuromonadales bacterium]|nr:VTT domain-containing protein [Desulfuromonadales bacterium]
MLRDWVQNRFHDRLAAINRGVEKEGAFYLFTLRLVPIFPFFIINLVMGLTPMRTLNFYWVSQVGMLAGSAVYANAGTQLGQINSLSGILSPGLLFSFVLLGVFPLIARKGIEIMKKRQTLKNLLSRKNSLITLSSSAPVPPDWSPATSLRRSRPRLRSSRSTRWGATASIPVASRARR